MGLICNIVSGFNEQRHTINRIYTIILYFACKVIQDFPNICDEKEEVLDMADTGKLVITTEHLMTNYAKIHTHGWM